jgi:transcriptional regulator with PAS, ATPase and Fis domain
VEIHIPPLRERPEDIPALFDLFLDHYARKYNLTPKRLAPGTLQRLQAHDWPGNIREFRHAVERALIMSDRALLESSDFFLPQGCAHREETRLDDYNLESVEQQVIRKALTRNAGNVSRTAKELGISRASLYRRMDKYGL